MNLDRSINTEDAPESTLSNDFIFSEALYMSAFTDVAYAVARGRFASGHAHYIEFGRDEIAAGRRKNIFSDSASAERSLPPEQTLFDEVGDEFFEELYLELNADVADAVRTDQCRSGQAHWRSSGWYERAHGTRPMINFTAPARPFADYTGDIESSHASTFDETLYRLLYPDLHSALSGSSSGYQHWRNHGRYEARIGPGLPRKPRCSIDLRELASRPLGFNIYGAFATDSGLGTASRSLAKAVKTAGYPVDLWCFRVANGEIQPASHHRERIPLYSINLLCANADQMMRLFAAYDEGHFNDAYNIALWQWELAAFRPDWFFEFEGLNEIWTNSEFQRQSITSIAPIPVRNVHLPVSPSNLSRDEFRDELGLPRDKFTFFLSFDVGSTLLRKNPFVAISAFLAHYTRFPQSHLVVKFHGSDHDSSTLRRLLQSIGGHESITVIAARLDMIDLAKLRASCDCLLSPHRSEGFGLQIAEFMARGKSVIATGYSGVCDFFDETVGYPITYDLVELDVAIGPYRKGSLWAEPHFDNLLLQMEAVQSNVAEADLRRAAAKTRMETHYSLTAIGRDIRGITESLDLNAAVPAYLAGIFARVKELSIKPLETHTYLYNRAISGQRLFSIVIPVYNVPGNFLRQCIESVFSQNYRNWEICICNDASTRDDTLEELRKFRGVSPFIKLIDHSTNQGISAATNSAIHLAAGQFIVLLDHDDLMMPNALEEIERALQIQSDADVIYTDEIKIDEHGLLIDHYYKPDWSPEHLESVMYVLHMLVIRKSLLLKVGGFRSRYSGAQDYDLMLRCSRETPNIVHVPVALYQWRAIPGSAAAIVDAKPEALKNGFRALQEHVHVKYGSAASVQPGLLEGTFRVRRPLSHQPGVSLLILTANSRGVVPGRGEVSYVENFIESIIDKTDYGNYEIVVIDDNTLTIDQLRKFEKLNIRVVNFFRSSKSFNYAEKANFAISQSRHEHIVLLNDDMEIIREDWLTSLLEMAVDPGIGAVGARLLHADGSIQHVGMVLGVLGGATHIYHSYPENFVGYNGFTHIIRNYSSVTAACLATRKSVMSAIGGFDARFMVDYNDVDLCLRLVRAGYRIVYTPYAELNHFENATVKRRSANQPDVDLFEKTWRNFVDKDPHYNVNLTRLCGDYSLRL